MKSPKPTGFLKNIFRRFRWASLLFVGSLILIAGGYLLRFWLDREIDIKVIKAVKENYPISSLADNKSPNSDLPKNLVGGSFSDTFSGSGWLAGSNIYQDRYTTGLTPFPNIDLKQVSSAPAISEKNKCPQNVCLTQSGGGIYADKKRLDLPEIDGTLVSLDISPLTDVWILGLVFEKNKLFYGSIYVFDGVDFQPVSSAPLLETRYSGHFAFAGDSRNWLAVYGSYEGRAWEGVGGNLRDISFLLNPRVMRGGFMPKVFKIDSNWFVSNSAGGFPLLKFFSGSGRIIGALDLTDLIDEKFSDDLRSIKAESVSGSLFLELTGLSNKPAWFELIDSGFSYSGRLEAVSNNLRSNQPQPLVQARFLELNIYPNSLIPNLFLSNSGKDWQKTKIGEWVEFPKVGEELYWRADFSEIKEPFFLDSVRVEYGLGI